MCDTMSEAGRAACLKQIAEMTRYQVCQLWRFGLPGHPFMGGDAILTEAFTKRFNDLGGFSPEISKQLGF